MSKGTTKAESGARDSIELFLDNSLAALKDIQEKALNFRREVGFPYSFEFTDACNAIGRAIGEFSEVEVKEICQDGLLLPVKDFSFEGKKVKHCLWRCSDGALILKFVNGEMNVVIPENKHE